MVRDTRVLRLAAAVRSEVGRRANNEDAAFASPRLAAVADGVGGAAAGEVASRAAIEAMIHLDKCRLSRPLEDELQRAVGDGNERIALLAEWRPQYAGMGTTLTAVALGDDGTYALANVGDSRTYLLREGRLTQLTRDDSFIQQLIETGRVTPEQARRHPQRSVVLAALDGEAGREAKVESLPAQAGDRLLLCSDGVSDVLDESTIAEVLSAESRDACAERLVELALSGGSRDNLTAVVADVVPDDRETPLWQDAR